MNHLQNENPRRMESQKKISPDAIFFGQRTIATMAASVVNARRHSKDTRIHTVFEITAWAERDKSATIRLPGTSG